VPPSLVAPSDGAVVVAGYSDAHRTPLLGNGEKPSTDHVAVPALPSTFLCYRRADEPFAAALLGTALIERLGKSRVFLDTVSLDGSAELITRLPASGLQVRFLRGAPISQVRASLTSGASSQSGSNYRIGERKPGARDGTWCRGRWWREPQYFPAMARPRLGARDIRPGPTPRGP
jgi:hypothetical protein